MNPIFLAVAVFLPIVGGILIALLPIKNRKLYLAVTEVLAIATSVLVWVMILNKPDGYVNVMSFVEKIDISFRMDGLSMVFAGLISVLWPLAILYSFEYMEHEASDKTIKEKTFFAMYVITYGVTLGISFAKSMMTMYCFYELLTLVTVPLVMFTLTREAILATRTYLFYSLGGAAFGFISLVFLIVYGDSIDFIFGGVLAGNVPTNRIEVARLIYVLAFFGFGVKAAVCPLNAWLPRAGVAPTPVTALLHAVAVVKSGAFAIIRLTYFSYGTDLLKDSWAQYVVMLAAICTIVYGSTMAVKEQHVKRRLAYSTISNLSYILFAATLMTPAGLIASLTHLIIHAVMKICAFFCAGTLICKAHVHYVDEINGLAKRMPKTFAIFTIASMALMGVPGLCGFVSKWYIASAAIKTQEMLPYIGVIALIISAILTAIYMLDILVRAYFPSEGTVAKPGEKCDPSFRMLIPLGTFVVFMFVLGLNPSPFIEIFTKIAGGLM